MSGLDPEELESGEVWAEYLNLMPGALLIDKALEKLLEISSKQRAGKSTGEEDQILIRFRAMCNKI